MIDTGQNIFASQFFYFCEIRTKCIGQLYTLVDIDFLLLFSCYMLYIYICIELMIQYTHSCIFSVNGTQLLYCKFMLRCANQLAAK